MALLNAESHLVAKFYGLATEGDDVPAWLVHIDKLKSREKDEREEVGPHVGRVADYAEELALSIGMDPRRAEEIKLATLWHDIGKLKMPDRFFQLGYKATPEDRADINLHAGDGRRMMEEVPGVPVIFLDIASYHHERYDGEGYNKLVGEDIPFPCRIVQVSDVYDGMQAARSYKPEVKPGQVLTKMIDDTLPPRYGRREYDPFLMRRFMTLREVDLGDSPESERAHLRQYAASSPMDDLQYLDKDPGVYIHFDGTREVGGPEGSVIYAPDGTVVDGDSNTSESKFG